jgi:hypothetical protein
LVTFENNAGTLTSETLYTTLDGGSAPSNSCLAANKIAVGTVLPCEEGSSCGSEALSFDLSSSFGFNDPLSSCP